MKVSHSRGPRAFDSVDVLRKLWPRSFRNTLQTFTIPIHDEDSMAFGRTDSIMWGTQFTQDNGVLVKIIN
jgi:hypothetical protein